MYYYIVNGYRYYNIYLAQYESYKSGAPVQFYCNTAEYDKLDWTKEPHESMEVLMDRHALHLRNKYERLIFFWSGGTDSQTMFDVFVRNKIHIDEIVCIGNKTLPYMPMSHGEWLQHNYWDKSTTITLIDKLDLNLRAQVIRDENWAQENIGDIRIFTNGGADGLSYAMCAAKHGSYNWALVSGHEKPDLVYRNGTWWTRQEDRPMRQPFGIDRIECFFLDPLMNLKQSHLLKNALKKLPIKYTNGAQAELVFPQGNSGYTAFAKACGRHSEFSTGVSNKQKTVHKQFVGLIFGNTVDLSSGEQILQELVKDNNPFAMRYLNGLRNIQSDQGFMEYINGFALLEPNQILRTQPVYSKPYNLGI